MKVNGYPYEKEVEPRRTLLELIREDLELTGTNEGEGIKRGWPQTGRPGRFRGLPWGSEEEYRPIDFMEDADQGIRIFRRHPREPGQRPGLVAEAEGKDFKPTK